MGPSKSTLIKDALKEIKYYTEDKKLKIYLINFDESKVLSTSNWNIVDQVNWDYAFVYATLGSSGTNGWKINNLFLIDSNFTIVNQINLKGWKLTLEQSPPEGYLGEFPYHNFIISDNSGNFLEKKYLLIGNEIGIKDIVFKDFISLTGYRNLVENVLDNKLDQVIELLNKIAESNKKNNI